MKKEAGVGPFLDLVKSKMLPRIFFLANIPSEHIIPGMVEFETKIVLRSKGSINLGWLRWGREIVVYFRNTRTYIECPNGQCDEIGRLSKAPGEIFFLHSSPSIWGLFGLFSKRHSLSKNYWDNLSGNFWKNFGYFLFKHLVTLLFFY